MWIRIHKASEYGSNTDPYPLSPCTWAGHVLEDPVHEVALLVAYLGISWRIFSWRILCMRSLCSLSCLASTMKSTTFLIAINFLS